MIDRRAVPFHMPAFADFAAGVSAGTAAVQRTFIGHALEQPIVQVAFSLWEGANYAGPVSSQSGLMLVGVTQLLRRAKGQDEVFDVVAPTRILEVNPDTYYLGAGISSTTFGAPLFLTVALFTPPTAAGTAMWDRVTDIYGTLVYGPAGDSDFDKPDQSALPSALPQDGQELWVPPDRS